MIYTGSAYVFPYDTHKRELANITRGGEGGGKINGGY